MRRHALLLVVPMLLTACPGNSGGQGNAAYDNVASTQDTTLRGTDADINGVRDDVDTILKAEFQQSAPQTLAATRYAQVLQQNLLATPTTADQATDLLDQQFRAAACLVYASTTDKEKVTARLYASTVNTQARIDAMQQLGQLAGGTAFTLPTRAECGL